MYDKSIQKTLICFHTSKYEDILEKGVKNKLYEFFEDNFFDNIIFVCPIARENKHFKISKKITIIEIGWKTGLAIIDNTKILKYPFFVLSLIKFFLHTSKNLLKNLSNHEIIARSTDPFIAGFIALTFARLNSLPFMLSIHSNYDLTSKKISNFRILEMLRLNKLLMKFVCNNAKIVMPIRKNLLEMLTKNNLVNEEKIIIGYHGININYEKLSKLETKKLGIIKSRQYITIVARLSPENLILETIDDICCGVLLERKDLFVIICGDGPQSEEIKYKVHKYGLIDRFLFLGFQSNEKVKSIRNLGIVSIVPMGGASLIEAMASNSLVIAYNIDWHNELVLHKKNGMLVKKNTDCETFSAAIIYIINKPNKIKKMIKEANHLIKNKYTLQHASLNRIKIYNKVLK